MKQILIEYDPDTVVDNPEAGFDLADQIGAQFGDADVHVETLIEAPEGTVYHAIDERELATILAALRYWQREGLMSFGHEQDIATDGDSINALNAEDIDALCESLNT